MELPIDLSLSEGAAPGNDATGIASAEPRRHQLINQLSDEDDFESSIISSDESMNAKITKMDFTDDNPFNKSRG